MQALPSTRKGPPRSRTRCTILSNYRRWHIYYLQSRATFTLCQACHFTKASREADGHSGKTSCCSCRSYLFHQCPILADTPDILPICPLTPFLLYLYHNLRCISSTQLHPLPMHGLTTLLPTREGCPINPTP